MPCTDKYAAAWHFASFFCVGSVRTGTDDSGGSANAALSDSTADFDDIQAGVGMVLYNTTQGTNGPVTARTPTTLTATGVTWDDGDAYRIVANRWLAVIWKMWQTRRAYDEGYHLAQRALRRRPKGLNV